MNLDPVKATPSKTAASSDTEIVARRASVQRGAQRAHRAVMAILALTCVLGVAMVAASIRAWHSQARAEAAEERATERLWFASLAQARAERLSAQAGHRASALAAISNAALIRPTVELRDEAIAAFALRDLELEVSWPLARGALGFYFDPQMEHYVVSYARGENSMFRLSDNQLVRTFHAAEAGLPEDAATQGGIFSATGRYFVSPFASGEIVLFERDTGKARHVFNLDSGEERLAWRPTFGGDDRTMCVRSASRRDTVVFVDLETGARRTITVPGVDDTVRMNQQGDTLLWSHRQELRFHSVMDGERIKTVTWPANVLAFRWDTQGERVSVWCGDGTLNLLDVKTGRIRQIGGKLVGPWVQHFSPDGTMLATAGNDGTSRIWDVQDARLLAYTSEARAFLWANDNERLGFAVPGQRVGVWRITRPRGYRVVTSATDNLSTVWHQDLSADGRWLMLSPHMVPEKPVIELHDLERGGSPLLLPAEPRMRAAFHPTEPRLFVASRKGLLDYRLPGTNAPAVLALPENIVAHAFVFSGDGRRAAIVGAQSQVMILNLTNTTDFTMLQGTAPVIGQAGPAGATGSGALALSHDGRWLAMGRNQNDGRVTVWDTATGEVAKRFATDHSHVAFSPDGRWLAAVGARECTLWEVGSWKPAWSRRRAPLVATVGAAAFTADGAMLAYTHGVDSLEIVEPATGRHIATLGAPTSIDISGLRFSANGRTLAAPAGQGRVHVWDMTALRGDLAKLGLDWPFPPATIPPAPALVAKPLFLAGAGLGAVVLAGLLGLVALRRHGRLTREYVEAAETAARLHESERATQLALEQEKSLSELKSQFVSTVSHEFRTPLGVIMSSAENLKDYHERFTPAQRGEHLHDIITATRTMSGLMEEVLLLGRVESGKVTFRPAPLELRNFCERVIEDVQSATSQCCPIELHVTPADRPARGDEGLLRHILVNLLTNAVKYSPDGRAVELRVAPEDAFAVVTIRDHGIGIPAEDLPHLFDPFHRGRNVGDIPGSGLGMVIVKRCVEMHGGTIACDSRENEGTTITVRLPLFMKLA